MMIERFYVNAQLAPGPLTLTGDEAHHLAHVRRCQVGDRVHLFNGDGLEYPAQLVHVNKRGVELDVQSGLAISREADRTLWMAAPIPKGDRAQFLIEKLTEIGAAAFIPLHTQRSIVQPRAAKLDKWHRTVIEASKQCGRNRLMTVEPMQTWESFLQRPDLQTHDKRLAHPEGVSWPGSASAAQPMTLAVGPEGGFTPAEIEQARAHGWQVVKLGASILRIETAALALAALALMGR